MTSRHRYPVRALAADYARAALGLALTAGPLVLVEPAPGMAYILGGLGTLFFLYGVRTVLRHVTRIQLFEEEIRAVSLWPVVVRWQDLSGMSLAYYSTRRDRSQGWMQLRLKGGGRTLGLDSTIEGFEDIADRAFRAARGNRVELNGRTLENLAALGIGDPVQAAAGGPQ
ncbi:MAG: hypothetical protein ACE5LL_01490 [Alphaproteobacteria bacterium]